MSSIKKAARLGAADLQASLAAASTSASARIVKLDAETLDAVAGGIDIGNVGKDIIGGGVGDGTTAGMFPPPTPIDFAS